MEITALKRSQLERLARYREELRISPRLQWLFFELTNRCNLNCKHCGSSCTSEGQSLTMEDIRKTLGSIRGDKPTVCLTGGEPMLHPNFFEIAEYVHSSGFYWGMTTNATMIDDRTASALHQAGMSTVSVSLDGMEESHDALRQKKGAWRLALRGLQSLLKAGFEPQVTTVVHQNNFGELDALYALLREMGIPSWRPINVEPIGRACESGDLLLRPDQFAHLLSYIRTKRFDRTCDMEVTFGCSHYLGTGFERMVRDYYFLCGAGITTAGIRCNGDICACLDIANRPDFVQGNIKTDHFMDVWINRFRVFRRDRTADCSKCIGCSERFICAGDSTHTWDFEKNEPLLCYRDYSSCLE